MLPALVRSLRPPQWAKNAFVLAPAGLRPGAGRPDALVRALGSPSLSSAPPPRPSTWSTTCATGRATGCTPRSAAGRSPPASCRRRWRWGPRRSCWPAPAPSASSLGRGFRGSSRLRRCSTWPTRPALKHVVILDVMIVAVGFVLRVLAGGAGGRRGGVELAAAVHHLPGPLPGLLQAPPRAGAAGRGRRRPAAGARALQPGLPRPDDQRGDRLVGGLLRPLRRGAGDRRALPHATGWSTPCRWCCSGSSATSTWSTSGPTTKNPTEAILPDPPFLLNLALWALAVVWIVYGTGGGPGTGGG